MTNSHNFDVVIVGAGTSGSATAYQIAKRGLSVAVVDKSKLSEAGARWSNALTRKDFMQADIPLPETPELENVESPFGIRVTGQEKTIKMDIGPLWNVDMPHLTSRLQDLAKTVGVKFFENLSFYDVKLFEGRPTSILTRQQDKTDSAKPVEFHAKLFVDATGLSAHLRKRVPLLNQWCPTVENKDICTAMQQVCKISDKKAAKEFLKQNNTEPGHIINIIGVKGGWSTNTLRISEDLEHVALLTGCIADGNYSNGPEMMSELVVKHTWIGERVSGGAGLIPLRHPYHIFTAPGIALVGDSACHVFPAHGSGVGNGMSAGKMLAEAITGQDDPGAWKHLWNYQARFQKEIATVSATYDIFRKFTQSLDQSDLAILMENGLINEASSEAGMTQAYPQPSLKEIKGFAKTLLACPKLAIKATPQSVKMTALIALYKAYPSKPSLTQIKLWSKAVAKVFENEPDVQ